MRKLNEKRSYDYFNDDLVYLEAALLARPLTSALAEPITAHLEAGEAVRQLERVARRRVIQAYARGKVADVDLDDGARDTHSDALGLVRQDRKARLFSTLFPGPINTVVKHALRGQIGVTRRIIKTLDLDLFPAAFREKHQAALGERLRIAEAALEARDNAEFEQTRVRLQVTDWKEEANGLRLGVYSQLLRIAAEQRHGRSWAEQFFMPHASGAGEEEEVVEEDDEVVVEREPVLET